MLLDALERFAVVIPLRGNRRLILACSRVLRPTLPLSRSFLLTVMLLRIGSGAIGLRSIFRLLAARGSRAGLFTVVVLLVRRLLLAGGWLLSLSAFTRLAV